MRCLFVILAMSAFPAANAFAQPKLPASLPPAEGKVVEQYTMRYIEVAVGTGKLAEPGKVYFVHYTGWLYDGTQFDTSRNKPGTAELRAGQTQSDPRMGRRL